MSDDDKVLRVPVEIDQELYEQMSEEDKTFWAAFFLRHGENLNKEAEKIFRQQVCGLVLPEDLMDLVGKDNT